MGNSTVRAPTRVYPARPVRVVCAAAVAASLLLSLSIRAQERPVAAEPATFMAQLDVDGVREPLPVTQGTAGPLFLLQPIVARLGATLDVVPLEQSHRLRIAETDVVLGPSTQAMTVGRSIVTLRQAPFTSGAGLWVPFEALEHSFGDLLGMDLRWFPDERVLEIKSRHAREVVLDVQVVHIQGVTTVVLQFDRAAKYQVAGRGPVVDVTLPLDRVRLLRDPKPPRQSLLERVETGEHRVRLFLASGAAAADPYVLPAGAGQNAARPASRDRRLELRRAAARRRRRRHRSPTSIPTTRRRACARSCSTPATAAPSAAPSARPAPRRRSSRCSWPRRSSASSKSASPSQVVLTRNEDADLPLDTRTAIANQTKGDLFISIHLNSAPESLGARRRDLLPGAQGDRRARAPVAEAENRGGGEPSADGGAADAGLQLILWDLAQSQHLAASQRLAQLIQQELNTTLGLRDRGVKQAPFAVLMGAAMPAVLVELGFITNPEEEKRLLDPAYRAELLDALVRAVGRFKAMVDGGAESAAVVRANRRRARRAAPSAPPLRSWVSRRWWWRSPGDRRGGPGSRDATGRGRRRAAASAPRQPVTVELYFPGAGGRLVREQRDGEGSADPSRVAAHVVQALLEVRAREKSLRPFPEGVTVGDVHVTGDGVAYVDLRSTGDPRRRSGSTVELLTLYSLVNSVVAERARRAGRWCCSGTGASAHLRRPPRHLAAAAAGAATLATS